MPSPAFVIDTHIPLNSKCHMKAHCKLYTYTRDMCGLESTLMNIPKH